jgi:hypothetical protein
MKPQSLHIIGGSIAKPSLACATTVDRGRNLRFRSRIKELAKYISDLLQLLSSIEQELPWRSAYSKV